MRRLLIFCGIPGSGKTTVAREVALRLGATVHIQTDRIRSMVARPTYSGAESRFVYRAAVSIAGEALRAGYDVILDGTFPREEYRNEAVAALTGLSSSTVIVEVVCDPRTASLRNTMREQPVPEESLTRLYRRFERPRRALIVDTDALSVEQACTVVLESLNRLELSDLKGKKT